MNTIKDFFAFLAFVTICKMADFLIRTLSIHGVLGLERSQNLFTRISLRHQLDAKAQREKEKAYSMQEGLRSERQEI